jgi:tetratricopeptide (TPR) repeat protein
MSSRACGGWEGPTFLVTSRERLQLQGEHVYAVPTLDESDGVALFATRARALDASFTATSAVGELCERLEQLPLALELAAARTVVFSVEQLLERLGQRLDLFRGGRDADPRQQTLRATISWSHDLLDEHEQRLFAQLSVFSGGCTYEAAEAVCGADPDALQSLLDKSLLRRRTDPAGGQRFWMLETIREFAAERLEKLGEVAALRAQHATYFLAIAEHEEQFAHGSEESASHLRLETDLDNFRAAHDAAVASGDTDIAIRLTGALHPFWYITSRFDEGHRRAIEALALGGQGAARARAHAAAGELALMQGDLDAARRHFDANLRLCLESEDDTSLAKAYTYLGHVTGEEGDLAASVGYYERTLQLIDEGARLDGWLTRSVALSNLGFGSAIIGDLETATTYLAEALACARQEESRLMECVVRLNLADVALRRDEAETARAQLAQTLPLLRHLSAKRQVVEALELLAQILALTRPEAAARLMGAAARLRAEMRLVFQSLARDEWLVEARSRIGDDAWEAAAADGRATEDPLELADEYLG